MKRVFSCVVAASLALSLLAGCSAKKPTQERYTTIFYDVFDTITTLRGYDVSQEAFDKQARQTHEALLAYLRSELGTVQWEAEKVSAGLYFFRFFQS